jgi:putative ATPase
MPTDISIPLAERVRPKSIDEVVGQQHLLAEGKPLRNALVKKRLHSMLLWGPPGVGKTTLARLIAQSLDAYFVPSSAVTSGVKEVRLAAQEAKERLQSTQQRTLLFLDEVHRFNKSQQDLLLPFVEDGTLTLIGATTENPSFEVNGALRSRLQLYVLKPLEPADIQALLERAIEHPEGLNNQVKLEPAALDALVAWSDGDARRALNALELASTYAEKGTLNAEHIRAALSAKSLAFDKGGEHFYNLMSALHKSVRGSDPDAALYWLARLLGGGADALYVARRLVRMSVEDIGLADPNALRLALAAKEAIDFLGQPEGELALAQCVVYLAIAPKSNRITEAWGQARRDAETFNVAEVPLHLRNAPTGMMKSLGYGTEYAYYFDDPEGSFAQRYFPESMNIKRYYQAGTEGWEQKVRLRLEELERLRGEAVKKGKKDKSIL